MASNSIQPRGLFRTSTLLSLDNTRRLSLRSEDRFIDRIVMKFFAILALFFKRFSPIPISTERNITYYSTKGDLCHFLSLNEIDPPDLIQKFPFSLSQLQTLSSGFRHLIDTKAKVDLLKHLMDASTKDNFSTLRVDERSLRLTKNASHATHITVRKGELAYRSNKPGSSALSQFLDESLSNSTSLTKTLEIANKVLEESIAKQEFELINVLTSKNNAIKKATGKVTISNTTAAIVIPHPLQDHIGEFWQLATEGIEATSIIRLNSKNIDYCPPPGGEPIHYTNLAVSTNSEEKTDDIYTKKELEIKIKGHSYKLTHFFYHKWKDNTIPPDDRDQFTSFLKTVCKERGKLALVHCQAGAGRSGTLLAAFQLLENPRASLFEIVLKHREESGKEMVGNENQYLFLKELQKNL